jgi:hypothetical protein
LRFQFEDFLALLVLLIWRAMTKLFANLMTPTTSLRLALCLTLALAMKSQGITFSVSPNSVSNLYAGNLTLQISGLTNGETVLVEHFFDLNGNAAVDANEPLVQSFRLTDGQVTAIAGVRNGNIPGDNDGTTNGQIRANLNFATAPEFGRGSGSHLLRVSSPTGRFPPVLQTLTVTQASYPQQITGTLMSSGSPIPFGMVGALIVVGSDTRFIAGTLTDGSGNFSLAVSNGSYVVVGFKSGYIGNFATSPQVTVSSANTNVTVPLTIPPYTVSGTITDVVNRVGLPGVQVFATSTNNEYVVLFSDAVGNFNVALSTGQWKLDPSEFAVMLGGYLRPGNKVKVNVPAGNVAGVTIPLTKGTALIYGAVKDDLNNALPGVRLSSGDNSGLFQCTTWSDASGNYFLAATNDTWNVGPDSQNAGLPAGYTLQQVQVSIADGQAVQTNLIAHRATAHLFGRALDNNSNPIGGASMLGFPTNGANVSAQTASDGSFDLPVSGGSWTISLDTQTSNSRGLVAPQLSFNVTDGVNISNIMYVAPISTRSISGYVKTGNNVPVTSINLFAGCFVNGTNYIAGATTDGSGNYSMPVLPAIWGVGVDSQALAQRGYGLVFSQNADTTSSNQIVNFVVGGPPVGFLFFRHNLGAVGEFGRSNTPVVTYPVRIHNYRALFHVFNETNPPDPSTVLFTGPPGSGLTNTPADPLFGVAIVGTDVVYASPVTKNPPTAMGGNWSVLYRSNPNNFIMPDPQALSRILVPLPTVTVSNDLLRSLTWTYKDQNGNPISGTPPFVENDRIDLFDQNGNLLDSEIFPASFSYAYAATNLYHWSIMSTVRMDYYDDLTNQYFVAFTESSPTLTGEARLAGQQYQFLLNGPAGQNYTVQFSTNLVSNAWNSLLITNSATSPIVIVDPTATNRARFYRVLVGP